MTEVREVTVARSSTLLGDTAARDYADKLSRFNAYAKLPAEVKLKAGIPAPTLEVAPGSGLFRARVCAMGPWPVRRQRELFVRRN